MLKCYLPRSLLLGSRLSIFPSSAESPTQGNCGYIKINCRSPGNLFSLYLHTSLGLASSLEERRKQHLLLSLGRTGFWACMLLGMVWLLFSNFSGSKKDDYKKQPTRTWNGPPMPSLLLTKAFLGEKQLSWPELVGGESWNKASVWCQGRLSRSSLGVWKGCSPGVSKRGTISHWHLCLKVGP